MNSTIKVSLKLSIFANLLLIASYQKMKGMKLSTLKGLFSGAAFMLCLLISNSSTAQTAYHLGLSVGGQQTTLFTDQANQVFNWQTGYYAGLSNEFRFGYKSSFEVNLLYSTQGAQRVYKDRIEGFNDNHYEIYSHNRTENFTYINGQFLYKYHIGLGYERIIPYDQPGKRVFLSLMVGPQLGYLMGYKSTGYTDSTFYPANPEDSEFVAANPKVRNKKDLDNDWFKTQKGHNGILGTDIGLVGGVGMMFLIGENSTFEFSFKYVYGLGSIDGIAFSKREINVDPIDITKSNVRYIQSTVSNQAIQVGVAYKVRIAGSSPNRNF